MGAHRVLGGGGSVLHARGHKSVGVCKPWPSAEIQFCGSLLFSRRNKAVAYYTRASRM